MGSTHRKIRIDRDGLRVQADIDATVSVNKGPGSHQSVSKVSRTKVVQGPPKPKAPEPDPKEEQ